MRIDGLTVTWGLVSRGVAPSKGVPFGPLCLFVWQESHAFLDGSPGEGPRAPGVFTG